jgi:hypothetical protein
MPDWDGTVRNKPPSIKTKVSDSHDPPGYAEFDSGVAQKFVIDSHGDGARPDEGTVIQRRAIGLPGRR